MFTVKNNPVNKTGNYWQLWFPASYTVTLRSVTVFVLEHISVKVKFNTVADNTVFSC